MNLTSSEVSVGLLVREATAEEVRAIATKSMPVRFRIGDVEHEHGRHTGQLTVLAQSTASELASYDSLFISGRAVSSLQCRLIIWVFIDGRSISATYDGRLENALRTAVPLISFSSSNMASYSRSASSAREPQLWVPAPCLRRDLSMPVLDSDLSLETAFGKTERAVRVMEERGGVRGSYWLGGCS
jgi:hypothetical protein